MIFLGRKDDLRLLKERDKAVLVAVWGRQRVGKTHLIEYAFKEECLWKFEAGIKKRKHIDLFNCLIVS